MKMFGLEKQGWYGTKWASMAKNSMQFRVDFLVENGRVPTTRDFVRSTLCKEDWKPVHRLLNRTHPVHARSGSKRSYQNTLDSFVSAVRDTSVVTRDVATPSLVQPMLQLWNSDKRDDDDVCVRASMWLLEGVFTYGR